MNIRAFWIVLFGAITYSWAQPYVYNTLPTREFGQRSVLSPSAAPNLVEGRELYVPQMAVVDSTANPPILYVADTGNNRVLVWKNLNSVTKGDFADLAIGQPDLTTTRIGGPGYGTPSGLSQPIGIAVDQNGNLYVVDTGNNRILRYPTPTKQTGDFPVPDLVIGQTSFSSGSSANQGQNVPNSQTIAVAGGSAVFRSAITFDRAGNLWFTDAGNSRVLRYPASALAKGQSGIAADLVLGQPDFVTNTPPKVNSRTNKTAIVQPSGIAFSADGDLYVSDAYSRVLYFKGPITQGQAATRILGVVFPTKEDPSPRGLNGCPPIAPQPCANVLGTYSGSTLIPPEGLNVLGNNLYVADVGNNRIVRFDTPDKWPVECVPTAATTDNPNPAPPSCPAGTSPAGNLFIGQGNDPTSVRGNRGGRESSSSSLNGPVGFSFTQAGDLVIADTGNNRVVVYPASSGYTAATKLIGQLDWNFSAPNLVEGKELFIFSGLSNGVVGGSGMAVDTSGTPPRLYIADSLNNRVLGFKDARNVKPGDKADIVIGQPDLLHASTNWQTGDVNSPTEQTLSNPIGIAVDAKGNLYVADAGNARVVRFPRPFDQLGIERADIVLGQLGFFSKNVDASRNTMRAPYGLAFTQAGHLLVSDAALNRVLLFKKPDGGDFTSGMAASAVFGQSDFISFGSGSDRNSFNSPRGIATDSSDRLYVCDTLNNRVSVYTGVFSGETNPPARFTAPISLPHGIAVNSRGEIWVTDLNNNRVLRFPIYEDWFNAPTTPISTVAAAAPFAVALDSADNVLVAEATNRVSVYYISATYRNAASYSQRGLAPGMLANIARFGPSLAPAGTNLSASSLPWPTTLGDLKVTVNGTPAPIFRVTADVISFQMPYGAPVNDFSDVQVVRASTGEVLSAGLFRVNAADPAVFTSNAQGSGQIAALNEDGTVNSPTNPVGRGKVISLFGTGLGVVSGAPADGAAASGPVPAPVKPVNLAMSPGGLIPDANILYFGLAPGLPGVWQMNILVPDSVPPSATVAVGFYYKDFRSTEFIDGNTATLLRTTIAVK